MLDNILASLYLLAWVLTLILYQWKIRKTDGGTAIICSYILYAIFSLFTLNDNMFNILYEPLKFLPFLFLFIMLMIALSPIIYFHFHQTKQIEEPNTRIFTFISIIIIICSFLLIPTIIGNFGTGIIKLFTDSDAGQDAYTEQALEASDSGSAISNIPAILFNALSDICIFLFFYYLTKRKKNILLIIALFFSLIINMLMPIMQGSRSNVILALFTIIVGYMLFKQFFAKKINRLIQLTGTAFLIATALPIIAITISRFDNLGGGVGGFLNWYVGQANIYFNNHVFDTGGTRNGDRILNLPKRIIDPSTPKNYVERREKYHNLNIDDNLFTTFVGDFVIDFGIPVTIIIFITFNTWAITQIKPRDGTVRADQLLLLYFIECICMQGGMYLFPYSDTGNLKVLFFMLLYIYLRFHEKLLAKFPIKQTP